AIPRTTASRTRGSARRVPPSRLNTNIPAQGLRWPAAPPTTRLTYASRTREPPFKDGSRQRRVPYAVCRGKRAQCLQVLRVEAYRDLFRARRANGDVQIFETPCKLLHAVTSPEPSLFLVIAEMRNLSFAFYCLHRPPFFPRH